MKEILSKIFFCRYGEEDRTYQELRAAVEKAGALDFIVNNNFGIFT